MSAKTAEVNSNRPAVRILMPLPDHDFDPTEAAIPWKACTAQGWQVVLATEGGNIPECDMNRLKGPLPGLLSASSSVQAVYQEMTEDPGYQRPILWGEIDASGYQALLLPGGDGPGVRQYLDSARLRNKVLDFWQQGKLIGALCHGMLVLARTIDPQTGHSVIYGHKVTAVPSSLDRFAYLMDSWFLKRGYVMYSRCVADEVLGCLEDPEHMSSGPSLFKPYVVCDGALVTSRWYLDAQLFSERFIEQLEQRLVGVGRRS